MSERCVCCGEIIPEGQQVCPSCKKGERKMAELKPCPFCGGEAKIRTVTIGTFKKRKFFYVKCCVCGNCTSVDREPEIVEEAWNRRAEDGK